MRYDGWHGVRTQGGTRRAGPLQTAAGSNSQRVAVQIYRRQLHPLLVLCRFDIQTMMFGFDTITYRTVPWHNPQPFCSRARPLSGLQGVVEMVEPIKQKYPLVSGYRLLQVVTGACASQASSFQGLQAVAQWLAGVLG